MRRNLQWGLAGIVSLAFVLAWAMPSMGASTAAVARKAFARANLAFHNADLAIDTSNKAKSTAGTASATASAASSTASAASSTANAANSTANQALSAAIAADEVQDNFSMTFDPGDISANTCVSDTRSRTGVLSSDEVVVTPPDTQPLGILTQAYTSSGSVTLVFCNVTAASQPINPPSGSYEFSTLR